MKKNLFILSILALVFVGCGGGNTGEKKQTKVEGTSVSYEMTEAEPAFTNAYIDISTSMRGYFSRQSDERFITAISNANPDKLMWMDNKFTEIKGNPTNQLLTGAFQGGDSHFHTMLEKIITRDSLSVSNGLSLLFTDGIISASNAETRNNPEYTRQSLPYFKNQISKTIPRGSNVAVAIFLLESKYNGTYYDYSNNPLTNIAIDNRPFYIIAVGKSESIRYFMQNNKLNSNLSEAFGIYDIAKNNIQGTTFLPTFPAHWNNNKLIDKSLDINLQLPDYIAKMGKDYILSNIVLEFNGKDVTNALKGVLHINGKSLKIEKWQAMDTKLPLITPGENTLKLSIKKAANIAWEMYYTENDKGIRDDSLEQGKTFALKYLIDGIKNAVEPDEVNIFVSEFKFNK